MGLNVADVVFIIVTLIIATLVSVRGFFDEFSKLFGYVAGFFVAIMFTTRLSAFIRSESDLAPWICALSSYFILFISGYLLTKGLGMAMQRFFEYARLQAIDHILGFILGFFEGIILIGLIMMLLSMQRVINVSGWIGTSLIFEKIVNPVFLSIAGYVKTIAQGL